MNLLVTLFYILLSATIFCLAILISFAIIYWTRIIPAGDFKNLLQRIKGYLIVGETKEQIAARNTREVMDEIRAEESIEQKALAHYCEICDRAWETVRAARAHKRIKHEGGKSNLPHLTSPQ